MVNRPPDLYLSPMTTTGERNDEGASPELSTIVVTIGLADWTGAKLPLRRAHEYKTTIDAVLHGHDFQPFLQASGSGFWEDYAEPTAVYAGFLPTDRLPELRQALQVQASFFGQDAIGLIVHGCTDAPSYVTAGV